MPEDVRLSPQVFDRIRNAVRWVEKQMGQRHRDPSIVPVSPIKVTVRIDNSVKDSHGFYVGTLLDVEIRNGVPASGSGGSGSGGQFPEPFAPGEDDWYSNDQVIIYDLNDNPVVYGDRAHGFLVTIINGYAVIEIDNKGGNSGGGSRIEVVEPYNSGVQPPDPVLEDGRVRVPNLFTSPLSLDVGENAWLWDVNRSP